MEQGNGRFVGIDLAKKSMEVCILEEGEACALAFVLARQ
jgi:hypothetical protein